MDKTTNIFLQETEAKYHTLFDSNRDSITILRIIPEDKFGNFIDSNSATTAIFGYTKKEILSMNSRDIEIIDDKKRKERLETLKSKGTLDFETIIKNKEGKLRNVEVKSVIINYLDEPAIMNISRDITEREELELNVKKAHKKLETILEAIPDLLFEVDYDGRIHYYQAPREDLLAVSPQMFLGKLFKDILPADVTKTCMAAIDEADKLGWSTGKQYALDLPQGKHWFEISVSPVKQTSNLKKRFILLARDITERKLAEKELNKSQEKLKNIFNLANSGIILANLDGTFLEFNDWWLKTTGYSREEFSLKKRSESTHPEDLENSEKWFAKLISGEIDKYKIEKRYVKKDKTIFWGEASISAIKDKNNKIINTVSVVTDITERKLAEQLLIESEEKYRGLVENSPDGIVIYVNERITYANSEALRIVKAINNEQVIGKSVLEFIHPDSRESIIQRMKEVVLDYNASEVVEEKLITSTGETIYVEIKAIPTIFEQQEAIQVIIHDITERKRTEDKIKQLSQAVEQSRVAIVITNTLGEIEYINPKFAETTGYSVDEILGQNSRILKSGHTTQSEYKHLWRTLIAGEEWFGEFHNKRKDGTLYWESASISPIFNSQGKATHYIAIKEDITERKNVEQQLIKAKEKAEESDRLKLSFLANMSHEIRTPMNGILGFTELLKERNLHREIQQEYINIIEKSGIRMLNIINDIISISKIESGQVVVALSETDIKEQLEFLTTFFKPEATNKGIKLLVKNLLSPTETIVKTDKEKLYAILTNLIKNALKFTAGGTIEFGCEKKGKNLEFFVKDTGLGISNSQKNIIFERFRQANDTISRSHEGSGLGLAISKAYIETLGGKIWVESEEGKGSNFYFTLPYNPKSGEKEKTVSKKAPTGEKIENKIKDLRILIVEDDAISKLLITIAVKPYSKEIIKVSTGIEAIDACRKNPDIDLVMMDINMPEMDGYEATKKIRQFNKNLIIIAQTANGMQSDHDNAIKAGCTDYISKPINISSLGTMIQKYFKK